MKREERADLRVLVKRLLALLADRQELVERLKRNGADQSGGTGSVDGMILRAELDHLTREQDRLLRKLRTIEFPDDDADSPRKSDREGAVNELGGNGAGRNGAGAPQTAAAA